MSGDGTLTVQLEASGTAARLPAVELVVETGPAAGARFQPKGARVVIGTHDSCDLRLTDGTVSRFHCELVFEEGRVAVRDLGSKNGTAIEQVKIEHAYVPVGGRVQVGQTAIRLVALQKGEPHRVPVSAAERFGALVGRSVVMRAAFATLERAAASAATVLLEAETGCGKEAAAEALHERGPRAKGPFVVVDCGAVPGPLIESELFGHERGAFTGAAAARPGAFEAADGGTLFLDEVGELPLELQPRLLRALEKREVKRVGANAYQAVDVRVIAATHRALKEQVNDDRFRADLYFRLAVIEVRLPPLRERKDDLPLLVEALLESLGLSGNPEAERVRTPEALARLAAHTWPGNVRELRNHLERSVALGEVAMLAGSAPAQSAAAVAAGPYKEARVQAALQFEKVYLEQLLARAGGNVSKAAKEAGIDRKYLYRLLWRHGMR